MSFEAVMGVVQRQAVAVESLGALAAAMRVQSEGIVADPAVAARLDETVRHLGLDPAALQQLTPAQVGSLVGMARAFLRNTEHLVDNPGRDEQWAVADPVILQGFGRTSMAVAPVFAGVAPHLGDLGTRLGEPGAAILDVGTGVGLLAVAFCQAFPAARVVGIDPYRPSLDLAVGNVADFGLADRIELRQQAVGELPDVGAFDLAWLPTPFIPRDQIGPALDRLHGALRPGGWVVFGLFVTPPEPLAATLNELRIVRSGGHPWDPDDAVHAVAGAGFADVRVIDRTWNTPVGFVVGRKV